MSLPCSGFPTVQLYHRAGPVRPVHGGASRRCHDRPRRDRTDADEVPTGSQREGRWGDDSGASQRPCDGLSDADEVAPAGFQGEVVGRDVAPVTIPRGATSDNRVGVTVCVANPAGVGVMVTVDVTVAVSVDVSVGVVVADPAGVGVAVAVDVTVAVRETNPLRVGVAVAETDGERTGEAVTDATTVAVVVSVNQGAGTGVMVVPGTMPATVAGDACNEVGTGMGVAVAIA